MISSNEQPNLTTTNNILNKETTYKNISFVREPQNKNIHKRLIDSLKQFEIISHNDPISMNTIQNSSQKVETRSCCINNSISDDFFRYNVYSLVTFLA